MSGSEATKGKPGMSEPTLLTADDPPQVLIRPYATERWVTVTRGVWTFALCPTREDADTILGLLRGHLTACHHCLYVGPTGGDHTCPCPHHDNDCPDHPLPAVSQ